MLAESPEGKRLWQGFAVLCLDLDGAKVRSLQQGVLPIFEPGLEPIVHRNREAGRLDFTTDVAASVAHGELQLIAVGTPPGEDGSADLAHVLEAARAIGRHMDGYRAVVVKSTVPVGTADQVRVAIEEELDKRRAAHDFDVVSNPEFLKEGDAVEDFMRPDRIVVGSESARATQLLRELYAPFQRNRERLMLMGVRSAELTKYAANAMLATRISFMNELANLAEALGADIEEVRQGIGADPRIGTHFLYPGAGFGGSCFPKDVKALLRTAQGAGRPLRVIAAVEQANEAQKHALGEKIKARFGPSLKGRRFAIWGLAFKPNTDDMREAPSIPIIESLLERGARIQVYDPEAMKVARGIFGSRVTYAAKNYDALKGADALAVVTEWHEFREPDFVRMRKLMRQPVVVDGRNIYEKEQMKALGFTYYSIGR